MKRINTISKDDYTIIYLGMGNTLKMWKIALITFLKYTTLALREEMQPSNLQLLLAYAAAYIEKNKICGIRRQENARNRLYN